MYFNSEFGIFGQIYELIDNYVFNLAIKNYLSGALPDLTSVQYTNMDLVCTLCATILTLFVVALPFIVVLIVIKLVLGGK